MLQCNRFLRNKKNRHFRICSVVPVVGVEPTRYCYLRILSPTRLPIPPYRHGALTSVNAMYYSIHFVKNQYVFQKNCRYNAYILLFSLLRSTEGTVKITLDCSLLFKLAPEHKNAEGKEDKGNGIESAEGYATIDVKSEKKS